MRKILIVDDAMFMRQMITNMLTEEGYEVFHAANGLEGIKMYKEHQPDIVTMDITMPEMNGIEAVKKIKEIDGDAKIIMCSAMGQQEMVVEAIRAGAKSFLVKPFKKEKVIAEITKVLNQ